MMLRTFCVLAIMISKLPFDFSESLLEITNGLVELIKLLRKLTHDLLICICLLAER